MEVLKDVVAFVIANHVVLIEGTLAVLTGVIAIAMVVPGEQPEKFLQGVVNFIKKFSKK
jgi:hydrogenase maturation factor